MSNRFHNKWHRKNHHTYGNLTNPDAAHDPIASPDQPFLGDFSLQGALCAVAPASAFAGYFYSNNTALCAFAGNRGLLVEGLNTNSVGIEVDAKRIALSAYSPNLGISVYSPNNALSAYGVERGIYSGSHKMGIQVSAGQTGIETTSPNLALIAGSPNVAIKAYSLNIPLSTAFGKNLMHGVVGVNTDTITNGKVLEVKGDSKFVGNVNVTIDLDVDGDVNIDGGDLTASTSTFNLLNGTVQTINFGGAATSIQMAKADATSTVNINGTKDSTSLTTGALVVDGGVGIAKTLYVQDIVVNDDVNIQGDLIVDGDLTVKGELTYLDTKVQVTSAFLVENSGTGPALEVRQTGNQPIAKFVDSDGDDIIFANNGYVGLNSNNPLYRLDVRSSAENSYQWLASFINPIATTSINNAGVGIRFQFDDPNGTAWWSDKKWAGLLAIPEKQYADEVGLAFYTQANVGLDPGPGNQPTEKIRINANGNLGIGTNNPSEKLTVNGNISSFGNNIFSSNSNNAALLITQTGTGEALRVEDSSPDSTPFIVGNDGRVYFGSTETNFNANLIIERPLQQSGQVASIYTRSKINKQNNVLSCGVQSVLVAESDSIGYTIPSMNAFFAEGTPLFNIGASATNVYGFHAYKTLSAVGLNNYGFYSDLVLSTDPDIQNYNFYSNGTAPNYFKGGLYLETTPTSTGTYVLVKNQTTKQIEQRQINPNTFSAVAPTLKTESFGLTNSDHDTTIIINSTSTTYIVLSATLNAGTSVSFIRKGTGDVIFQANPSVTINTAPTSDFKKIAFQNSLAGAYHEGSGNWFIYGDLLS